MPWILSILWPAQGSLLYVCQTCRTQSAEMISKYFPAKDYICNPGASHQVIWMACEKRDSECMYILCLVYVVQFYFLNQNCLVVASTIHVVIGWIRRTPGGLIIFLGRLLTKILSLAVGWTELYHQNTHSVGLHSTIKFTRSACFGFTKCLSVQNARLTVGAVGDEKGCEFSLDPITLPVWNRTVSVCPDYPEVTDTVTSGPSSDINYFCSVFSCPFPLFNPWASFNSQTENQRHSARIPVAELVQ